MKEQWKDVVGYEGLYRVSNMGSVFGCTKERMLKPYLCKRGGYPQVMLCKNGKRKHKQIHHLVLDNFVGLRPTPKHEARHLDGNPKNTRVTNLQWGTRSENVMDAVKHKTHFAVGRYYFGSNHHMSKMNEEDILTIRRMIKQGSSRKEMADRFGVHVATIGRIVTKKRWSHVDE